MSTGERKPLDAKKPNENERDQIQLVSECIYTVVVFGYRLIILSIVYAVDTVSIVKQAYCEHY